MEQLNRITQNPDVMGGKACIRGMRVTVGMIVEQIGAGYSVDAILAATHGEKPSVAQIRADDVNPDVIGLRVSPL